MLEVDYVIREFIHMLPSYMNLWIGKIKNYKNKILISSSSFNIGTNLKINFDDNKHKEKKELTSSPKKKTNKILK